MADVRPFRALRYNTAKISDPGSALAPPYDVVSSSERERLYSASPHNVIRIELPRDGDDPHAEAARTLQEWRAEDILVRDEQPAFYLYEQRFPHEGIERTRRALFARVRVDPWEQSDVLPHEHTLTAPKEDRLRLLRACRTNISPIYGLFRDDDHSFADAMASARPDVLFEGTDIVGHGHRLLRIQNDSVRVALRDFFGARRLYIADGHHRFETAVAYRDEVRAGREDWSGEEPENFALMALTPIDDAGLVVLPIHRLVHREPAGDLRALLDADFAVRAVGPTDATTLDRLLGELTTPHTFGMIGPIGAPLRLLRPSGDAPFRRTPADRPESWRKLDVSVLQYAVLDRCFGIGVDDVAAGGSVTFTEDADEAIGAVLSGEAQYALLVRPTPVEQILDVADEGARMPQKSTYFFPKLGTGLVLNPIED